MPRTARIILPETPHHIVQRGHNRSAVFIQNQDYHYYLDNLIEWSMKLDVKVHSFCLMTNHVHLLLQPGEDPGSISKLMKRLAARQCRYVNCLEARTGSIWEGRFKCSPVERDNYLLQCCRYIELNPVKANIVKKPQDYAWSSYRQRVESTLPAWMGEDEVLPLLSRDAQRAATLYRDFVACGCPDQDFIQGTTDRNQLLGSPRFVDEVERRTGKRIENRTRGRPGK
jgi:putative transposase